MTESSRGRRQRLWWSLGGLVIGSLALISLFEWVSSPANINWHRRSRDGISDLRAVDWAGKNLAGANLSGIIFRESDLSGAIFYRANLKGADLSDGATKLNDADLREANLTGAILYRTEANRANFSGAVLRNADMSDASLGGTRFIDADLQGAIMIGANLVAADLSRLKQPPAYLDRADLTNAQLPSGEITLSETRLCNTILPWMISQQGCFWPSYSLKQAAKRKDWRWMDRETSYLFKEAVVPANAEALHQVVDEITPEQIRSMPCYRLKTLDQLWHKASDGRFAFSTQRSLWESGKVNRDYTKFADTVGWRQNGKWLKFNELNDSEVLPIGYFPWHQWQVLEPTKTEPTRFRRVGFGVWMEKLKVCGI